MTGAFLGKDCETWLNVVPEVRDREQQAQLRKFAFYLLYSTPEEGRGYNPPLKRALTGRDIFWEGGN